MSDIPFTPGTGDSPATDPVLSILETLGGKPVLIPIWLGQKGPKFEDWQKLTWETTGDLLLPLVWSTTIEGDSERRTYKTSTYGEEMDRVRRQGGNLGVLLGAPSRCTLDGKDHVLCSIDIDSDEAVEPFLALNPWMRATLHTRGRRGGNFWLWIHAEGHPGKLKKFKHVDPAAKGDWGEFRADGGQTVIYGQHPEGMRYAIQNPGACPLTCAFSAIVWPEEIVVPWRKTAEELANEASLKLAADYGPPWFEGEKGGIVLNPPYFVAKYAGEHRTLYEPDEGAFYQYEAARGLWVKTTEDAIRWDMGKDFKAMADEAKKPELITVRTNSFLKNLADQLRGATEKRNAFQRVPGLVHLANGVLDLTVSPPVVRAFSPDFYSRNQIPVALDEAAQCPRFLQELIASAMSAEDADLLQRWAGSLLLGPNIMQRFALFYGTAGGGKSTLVGLLRKMIGEASCTQLRTKHLEERFEMFFYVGKQLLIAPDVKGDFLQEDGAHVIKALVGNDPLSAERKQGGEAIQIMGNFHIAITCNSRLLIKLDGDADAFRRRMLPFLYSRPKPEKPDPDFLDHLFQSEGSGILNWMIAGAVRALEEKKAIGGFALAAVHTDRIDSLLAESDSVRHFVGHAIERAEGETITVHELGEAYTKYCDVKGWRAETYKRAQTLIVDLMSEVWRMTPRNDVKRASGDEGKQKDQRGYKGLRLIKAETTEDTDGHDA